MQLILEDYEYSITDFDTHCAIKTKKFYRDYMSALTLEIKSRTPQFPKVKNTYGFPPDRYLNYGMHNFKYNSCDGWLAITSSNKLPLETPAEIMDH